MSLIATPHSTHWRWLSKPDVSSRSGMTVLIRARAIIDSSIDIATYMLTI